MKKLLAILLCVMMMTVLFTVTASAAEYEVTTAADLQTKLNEAANGDTVKLGGNIDVSELTDGRIGIAELTSETKKTVTLDLNGYSITSNGEKGFIIVRKYYTLEINATSGGSINLPNSSYVISANKYAVAEINAGTFSGACTKVGTGSGTVSVLGGEFTFDPANYLAAGYAYNKIATTNYVVVSGKKAILTVGDNSTAYDTFGGAFTQANNETTSKIVLTDNASNTSGTKSAKTVNSEKNITVDLNGYNYNNIATTAATKTFAVSGTLTVMDSKGGGEIRGSTAYGDNNGSVIYVSSGGVFTLNSGTITSRGGKNAIYAYKGPVNITGGTITGEVSKASTGAVSITGGEFSVNPAKSYLASGYTSYSVGTTEAPKYVVTNTTETLTYDYNLPEGVDESGNLPDSVEIGFPTGYTYSVATNLSTKVPNCVGYKFVGWKTNAKGTDPEYEPGANYNFTGKATLYAHWEELTVKVAKIGETEYYTIQNAVNKAKNGDTITVISGSDPDDENASKVVLERVTVPEELKITIDLNGYKLLSSSEGSALVNKGVLTLKGNGEIEGTAGSTGGGIDNSGTLTIESGYIHGHAPKNGGGIYSKGTLIINGGRFGGTVGEGGLGEAIYAGSYSGSVVTVNGGNFDGTIATKAENSQATIKVNGGMFKTETVPYLAAERTVVASEDESYPYEVKWTKSYFDKTNYLNLSDSLEFSFFAELRDEDVADAKVTFAMEGYTKDLGAVTGVATGNPNEYEFKYKGVSPVCIGTKITATLKIGDAVVDTYETTVLDYLKKVYEAYDDYKAVVRDLTYYCAAARAYNYESTGTNATEFAVPVEFGEQSISYDNEAFKAFTAPVKTGEGSDNYKILTANAILDVTNSIVIKFKMPDGSKVYVGEKDVTNDIVSLGNYEYTYTFTGIKPTQYATGYELKLGTDAENIKLTFSYSLFNYAYAKHNGNPTAEKSILMKALAEKMYQYGVSVMALPTEN